MALVTAKQLAARIPGIQEGGVRADLFNRESNGLLESGALIFRGRCILIDEDHYVQWLRDASKKAGKVRRRKSASGGVAA